MKIQKFLLIGAAAAMLAGTASAADVTINVTGSTAFRAAAVKAILDSYSSAPTVAYVSSFSGGSQQLFKGTATAINPSGLTYIRTSWNGSSEGVQALAGSVVTKYIPITATTSAITGTAAAGSTAASFTGGTVFDPGTNNANLVTDTPTFAFSDVYQASTPVLSPSFTSNVVGICLFQWVAAQGAVATTLGSTPQGMTTQIANKMLAAGSIQLSQFTGNSADNAKNVYLTGRYNGSGTRATELAEVGYGVFNTVVQYQPTAAVYPADPTAVAAGSTIRQLNYWPDTGTPNVGTGQVNDDSAGNGGFNGGGDLAKALESIIPSTGTNVNVNGTDIDGASVGLVGVLGVADAYTASHSFSAVTLPFNGVTFSQAAVENGQYTFWSNEQIIHGTLSAGATALVSAITSNLGNAFDFYGVNASPGLATSLMHVSRSTDGGLVGP